MFNFFLYIIVILSFLSKQTYSQCWQNPTETYGRGVGSPVSVCPSGTEKSGNLKIK